MSDSKKNEEQEQAALIPPSTPIGAGIELEDSEVWPEELTLTEVGAARARLEADLIGLNEEVALLRERLRLIAYRSRLIVRDETTYIHSSARAQLGDYPWAKVAAAFGVTFVVTRLIRDSLR